MYILFNNKLYEKLGNAYEIHSTDTEEYEEQNSNKKKRKGNDTNSDMNDESNDNDKNNNKNEINNIQNFCCVAYNNNVCAAKHESGCINSRLTDDEKSAVQTLVQLREMRHADNEKYVEEQYIPKTTYQDLQKTYIQESPCNRVHNENTQEFLIKDIFYRENENFSESEVSLINASIAELATDEELWIADTGCTAHVTFSRTGLTNLRSGNHGDTFTMGNGQREKALYVGTLQCQYKNIDVSIANVSYSENAKFNLFSINSLLANGWILHGDNKGLILRKGDVMITFDIIVPTRKGKLFCTRIKRREAANEVSLLTSNDDDIRNTQESDSDDEEWIQTMNITKLHAILGHAGEQICRDTAKQLNIKLSKGSLRPCAACLSAKAKKESLNVHQHKRSEKNNERIYLDLSRIVKAGDRTIYKPNWRLIVDEYTGMKFTDFFTNKNKMIEPTCELLHKWKEEGNPVRYIRCDNAGENKGLEARLNSLDWKMGNIRFEYTARDTPQANCLVEIGFNTLYNRARAMLHYANVPWSIRGLVAKDCIKTATLLDSLLSIKLGDKTATRWEHYYGEKPKFGPYLKIWGMAGVVKTKMVGTPKLQDRGKVCMFIGYAENHHVDTYRMFCGRNKTIYTTRDVKWLDRMYYDSNGSIITDEIIFNNENELPRNNKDTRDNNDKDRENTSNNEESDVDNATKARKGDSVQHNENNNDKVHNKEYEEIRRHRKEVNKMNKRKKGAKYTGNIDINTDERRKRKVTFIDLLNDEDSDEDITSSTPRVASAASSTTRNRHSTMARDNNRERATATTTTRAITTNNDSGRASGRQSRPPERFTYQTLGETGKNTTQTENTAIIQTSSTTTEQNNSSEESEYEETDNEMNTTDNEAATTDNEMNTTDNESTANEMTSENETSIYEDYNNTTDTEQSETDTETINMALTKAELLLYNAMHELNDFEKGEIATVAGTCISQEYNLEQKNEDKEEFALVGTVGHGFISTEELAPMKYKAAMNSKDKEEWIKAIDEEYNKFLKYNVFKPVKIEDVPKGAKFLTTTWAMKKKANGTYRARMNMRGYEQEDGVHYDSASIASPVTNDITIRMMMVLMLMTGWIGYLVDVKGAFLLGEFENNEQYILAYLKVLKSIGTQRYGLGYS
jgi:hypothetical protein